MELLAQTMCLALVTRKLNCTFTICEAHDACFTKSQSFFTCFSDPYSRYKWRFQLPGRAYLPGISCLSPLQFFSRLVCLRLFLTSETRNPMPLVADPSLKRAFVYLPHVRRLASTLNSFSISIWFSMPRSNIHYLDFPNQSRRQCG
jgi:hypothetical protein